VLGACLDLPPANLCFGRGEQGKPFLEGGISLAFNLSHTGNVAALAVAERGDVGIDVELVRPLREPVAERFFSPAENQVLKEHADDQQEAAFYRCWTRKEAFIKALGTGLSTPLDKFDVAFASGEQPRLLRVEGSPDEPANWAFWHFEPRPDCMGAAAVRAQEAHFKVNNDKTVNNDRIAVAH
jgi:4'-phosphopantetheinyl transferase